jgi:hypothetical protein
MHRRMLRHLPLLAALLLAAAPAAAQVYKCPGPDGKLVFTDAPCTGGYRVDAPSEPGQAKTPRGRRIPPGWTMVPWSDSDTQVDFYKREGRHGHLVVGHLMEVRVGPREPKAPGTHLQHIAFDCAARKFAVNEVVEYAEPYAVGPVTYRKSAPEPLWRGVAEDTPNAYLLALACK